MSSAMTASFEVSIWAKPVDPANMPLLPSDSRLDLDELLIFGPEIQHPTVHLPIGDSRNPTLVSVPNPVVTPAAPSVQSLPIVAGSPLCSKSLPRVILPPPLQGEAALPRKQPRSSLALYSAKKEASALCPKLGASRTERTVKVTTITKEADAARRSGNTLPPTASNTEVLPISRNLTRQSAITTTAKKLAPHQGKGSSAASKQMNALSHPKSTEDDKTPIMAQRPPSTTSKAISRSSPAAVSRSSDWTQWVELSVGFSGFPNNSAAGDVWNVFKREGNIYSIELYDGQDGRCSGRGRVRFSPPPNSAFWKQSTYHAKLDGRIEKTLLTLKLQHPRRSFLVPSLVDPSRRYPESLAFTAASLDFGFMFEPTTMMGMYRTISEPSNAVTFRLDLLRREIQVSFQICFQELGTQETELPEQDRDLEQISRTHQYSFRIPLAQVATMHRMNSDHQSALLLSVESPPNFYRKCDEKPTHLPNAMSWIVNRSLYRQTDILFDPKKLRDVPLTLKKTRPIIDIGRWSIYYFVFDMKKTDQPLFKEMCNALRDFNIGLLRLPDFKIVTDREPAVWEYINRPIPQTKEKTPTALDDLIAEEASPLSFPVRYQLEVCISEGWLNEHNMTKEFVDTLMATEPIRAQDLLEFVANQKRRVFNPMEIFDMNIKKGAASRLEIPHYCTYVRSAIVTPSMIYFSTPYVETSNRVLRQYAEHADRFLRVRFTDEKFQGRLHARNDESMNEIFTRVKRALNNGITIGDRHYEYLASGNSQFREHGAYFYCPMAHLGVTDIRKWMGDFHDIKVVAKYAARLGQCFSTTRAVNGSRVDIREIRDIKNGKYIFTDGVGKISKFLAQMAASEIGVDMPTGEPPSVFQFRLGGAKGVLAVSPDAKMREIHLRDSQYKFHALHSGLEIVRCSQFSAAHLNRQLIIVLSALGVPDMVFVEMLKSQLSNLAQAMSDEKMALMLLQKEIDPNQMTLAVAAMVLDGFQSVREPFMLSILQLWRAWSTKYLKEKAKIVVHKGAVLLGCVDETGILRGHFDGLQQLRTHESEKERIKSLPEVYVQLSKGLNDQPQVILGPMILARNPSLHPGDIRVVCGVDVPALCHLKDVVVLPQTGDRDVAHMCSGGDLDGDDYLVIWDGNVLPREWNHNPMNYTPPTPVEVGHNVETDDITTFFVNYMKNNTLPAIAHAHLAYADFLENGVKDERCLKLAALHSKAVDYPKTGVNAVIPAELRPKKWPHFMEKKNKPKDRIYVSKKVLGQLYDQVERVDFVPEFETAFDQRILTAYKLEESVLTQITEIKTEYDAAMYRIMAQHEISTEFEVWSTFVLQHANQSKDFKFHEEMGAISIALKDSFRNACYNKAGGKDFEKIGPFVAGMYKVTNNQVLQALERRRKARLAGRELNPQQSLTKNMPLISFPWLFPGILGKIANGELTGPVVAEQGKPKKMAPKKRILGHVPDGRKNVLRTVEGLVHRGELLKLFDHGGEDKEKIKSSGANPIIVSGRHSALGSAALGDNKIAKGRFLTDAPMTNGHHTPDISIADGAKEGTSDGIGDDTPTASEHHVLDIPALAESKGDISMGDVPTANGQHLVKTSAAKKIEEKKAEDVAFGKDSVPNLHYFSDLSWADIAAIEAVFNGSRDTGITTTQAGPKAESEMGAEPEVRAKVNGTGDGAEAEASISILHDAWAGLEALDGPTRPWDTSRNPSIDMSEADSATGSSIATVPAIVGTLIDFGFGELIDFGVDNEMESQLNDLQFSDTDSHTGTLVMDLFKIENIPIKNVDWSVYPLTPRSSPIQDLLTEREIVVEKPWGRKDRKPVVRKKSKLAESTSTTVTAASGSVTSHITDRDEKTRSKFEGCAVRDIERQGGREVVMKLEEKACLLDRLTLLTDTEAGRKL